MNSLLLQVVPEGLLAVPEGIDAVNEVTGIAGVNSFTIIAIALGLIIATVLIILLVKKIIINSILGLVGWTIVTYVFPLGLPFFPSLVVSIVFGLAGVGVMLLLRFFGLF